MTVTINIPSQLPALAGNANLYLRVNAGANGIEWAAAGGGITIGTTAIASGTVGRVLFEGAGNVVQQNAAFVWNNTDNRLILGTESSADTNSRLVVIGKGTGTNNTFAVHNSTGNNNSLIVKDDGFIGFGALPYSTTERFRFRLGTNQNLGISPITGGVRLTSLNDANSAVQTLSLAGSSITFIGSGGTSFFTMDTDISVGGNRRFIASQSGADVLPIRVANSSGAAGTLTGIEFQAAGFQIAAIKAKQEVVGSGTGELQFYVKTRGVPSPFSVTQVMTLFSDNVVIGTTTDVASSILTLQSTTKGFLPPRMTTAQRNLIATPATGLTIFNTTTNTIDVRDNVEWKSLSTIDELQIALTSQVYN
jgi:hypothetical protein